MGSDSYWPQLIHIYIEDSFFMLGRMTAARWSLMLTSLMCQRGLENFKTGKWLWNIRGRTVHYSIHHLLQLLLLFTFMILVASITFAVHWKSLGMLVKDLHIYLFVKVRMACWSNLSNAYLSHSSNYLSNKYTCKPLYGRWSQKTRNLSAFFWGNSECIGWNVQVTFKTMIPLGL